MFPPCLDECLASRCRWRGSSMSLLVWTDAGFLASLDAAFADSARRSGEHLLCGPGCNQCCTGIFAISALDELRLQAGFTALAAEDAARAERIRERVLEVCARLAAGYPGDPETGALWQDEASQEPFEEFANEETCPVLDPSTGTCDLYSARPVTCRVFGPPVRQEDGLGVCDLCFQHAVEAEVAAAEMVLPPPEVEAALTAPLGGGTTTIAFALRRMCAADPLC